MNQILTTMIAPVLIGAHLAAQPGQLYDTQSQSGPNCAPRQQVVDRLASRYGETRQSIGLGANNQLVEVFASLQSGSWTITVTTASGVTCLIASGQAFETHAVSAPTPETDA